MRQSCISLVLLCSLVFGMGAVINAAAAPTPAPLYSFEPGTPAEQPFIFLNIASGKIPWAPARGVDGTNNITYVFKIPDNINGADCILRLDHDFAVSVAPDKAGEPGAFQEVLNSFKLFGRELREELNIHDYVIDLTPYLRDNRAHTVYVKLTDPTPRDAWGVWIWHVDVVARDAAEIERAILAQHQLRALIKEWRSRCVLYFWTDGGPSERKYLYRGNDFSVVTNRARTIAGTGYLIYRLPLRNPKQFRRIKMMVHGDYKISIAPSVKGKPNAFQEVALARASDNDEFLAKDQNWRSIVIDLPRNVLAGKECFVKIADGAMDKSPAVTVLDIGLYK
jgi:hypothetical protein